MKILLTGFDPFGGESVNPAFEAVKLLPDEIQGHQIIKVEVPTVFHKSIRALKEALDREKPDVTICVGQAGGRFDMTIERVAINQDDARIPDNEGNQPIDEKIFEDGENAYFSKLPIKAVVAEIRKHKIPASISNSAGTYVCNHIMYGLLYYIHKAYPQMRGGFIHVPFIAEQVIDKPNMPYMGLEDIAKALEAAVIAAANTQEDIRAVGGKTH